ncbi:MAG: hypothetical protein JW984_01895 [Deltaproteobacteria bacterium]|uniref:RadC-like JAB domain-containing protein n=1 Tax=Candidatus Zymogenus saltonus TaxID=2844893 RepID=A0A9D8KBK1_9DELT|nr:hypothetical protein [Candidatus Zymogenus saltonus]
MLDFIITIFILCTLFALVFVITHLRPLRDYEIKSLAIMRRDIKVRIYYSFRIVEFFADKNFKKKMNPNGEFCEISEELINFPGIAASLLKYKKHEWTIIGFEKDRLVNLIWLNKGFDNKRVNIYLPLNDIANIALRKNYNTVLIFHNHPNTNPRYYSCINPSDQDLKTASEFAQVLNDNKIGLLEFVCERGGFYEYFYSPSDSFFPLANFVKSIERVNGSSLLKNLSLHIERIRKKGTDIVERKGRVLY